MAEGTTHQPTETPHASSFAKTNEAQKAAREARRAAAHDETIKERGRKIDELMAAARAETAETAKPSPERKLTAGESLGQNLRLFTNASELEGVTEMKNGRAELTDKGKELAVNISRASATDAMSLADLRAAAADIRKELQKPITEARNNARRQATQLKNQGHITSADNSMKGAIDILSNTPATLKARTEIAVLNAVVAERRIEEIKTEAAKHQAAVLKARENISDAQLTGFREDLKDKGQKIPGPSKLRAMLARRIVNGSIDADSSVRLRSRGVEELMKKATKPEQPKATETIAAKPSSLDDLARTAIAIADATGTLPNGLDPAVRDRAIEMQSIAHEQGVSPLQPAETAPTETNDNSELTRSRIGLRIETIKGRLARFPGLKEKIKTPMQNPRFKKIAAAAAGAALIVSAGMIRDSGAGATFNAPLVDASVGNGAATLHMPDVSPQMQTPASAVENATVNPTYGPAEQKPSITPIPETARGILKPNEELVAETVKPGQGITQFLKEFNPERYNGANGEFNPDNPILWEDAGRLAEINRDLWEKDNPEFYDKLDAAKKAAKTEGRELTGEEIQELFKTTNNYGFLIRPAGITSIRLASAA